MIVLVLDKKVAIRVETFKAVGGRPVYLSVITNECQESEISSEMQTPVLFRLLAQRRSVWIFLNIRTKTRHPLPFPTSVDLVLVIISMEEKRLPKTLDKICTSQSTGKS